MSKKIAVVGPYNTPDETIKQQRLDVISSYCLKLFRVGDTPVSPLLFGLTLASYGSLPTDTETWRNFSILTVRGCDEMHVLMLEGWKESSGVQAEIAEAEKTGIKIIYIDLNKNDNEEEIN